MNTTISLPVLPELDAQDFDLVKDNLSGRFTFEFLEEFNVYTRYGIYYSPSVLGGHSSEEAADLNERLPDVYVCNDCMVIDSDIAEYGCSHCGNGEE